MTTATPGPFDVPAASFAYLERAAASLREAVTSTDVGLRYAHAHIAPMNAPGRETE